MSTSVLEFKLKREVELDKKLKPIGKESIGLHACHDSVCIWVANVNSYEEALEKIQPENILYLFKESMDLNEIKVFNYILSKHPEYYFYDNILIYNKIYTDERYIENFFFGDDEEDDDDDEYTKEDHELDAYNESLIRFCAGEENDEI